MTIDIAQYVFLAVLGVWLGYETDRFVGFLVDDAMRRRQHRALLRDRDRAERRHAVERFEERERARAAYVARTGRASYDAYAPSEPWVPVSRPTPWGMAGMVDMSPTARPARPLLPVFDAPSDAPSLTTFGTHRKYTAPLDTVPYAIDREYGSNS